MRIIKPMRLGIMHRAYSFEQQHHLTITVVAFFDFHKQGELKIEMPCWPYISEISELNIPFDTGMQKTRGEVLLMGNACAVGDEPITETVIGFELESIKKELKITGQRYWKRGIMPLYEITEPEPFTEIFSGYAMAFGGEKYTKNTIGKAYESFLDGLKYKGDKPIPMPVVEYPDRLLTHLRQRPEPGSFFPMDVSWEQRRKNAGSYNKTWLEQDFPGFARDIDWRIFDCVPADQQKDGFFQGNESFKVWGMNRKQYCLEGKLPNMKARAFIKRKQRDGHKFIETEPVAENFLEEVPLKIDTVALFPNKTYGAALFRGTTIIHDSDALDIESILVAHEHMADTPRNITHYEDVYKKRTSKNPKEVLAHIFNESQLGPIKSTEQLSKEEKEKQAAIDEMQAYQKESAQFQLQRIANIHEDFSADELTVPEIDEKNLPEQAAAYADNSLLTAKDSLPITPIPQKAIDRCDFDMTELLAQSDALLEEQQKIAAEQTKKAQQELDLLLAELDQGDVGQQKLEALEKTALPIMGVVEALDELRNEELAVVTDDQAPSSFDTLLKELQSQAPDISLLNNPDTMEQLNIQQEKAIREGRRLSLQATYPSKPYQNDVAIYLGKIFDGLMADNEFLLGRDFAGADLSHRDLSGLDLRHILLENANLSGCRFTETNLEGAVLTGAKLDDADFSGANLKKSNLSCCRGNNTCFSEAEMQEICFYKAEFTQSNFQHTHLTKNQLIECQFTNCQWQGSEIEELIVLQSCLDDCDLSKCKMSKSVLLEVSMQNISFAGSQLSDSIFGNIKADNSDFSQCQIVRVQLGCGENSLQQSNFQGTHAQGAAWRRTDLRYSNFSQGKFIQCDFGESRCIHSNFDHTALNDSIFMSADFTDASLISANLFQSNCHKVIFEKADLTKTNFYRAHTLEAVFTDAKLDDLQIDAKNRGINTKDKDIYVSQKETEKT